MKNSLNHQARLDALEGAHEILKVQCTELTMDTSDLNSEITQLETSNSELVSQVSQLEHSNSSSDSRIQALELSTNIQSATIAFIFVFYLCALLLINFGFLNYMRPCQKAVFLPMSSFFHMFFIASLSLVQY